MHRPWIRLVLAGALVVGLLPLLAPSAEAAAPRFWNGPLNWTYRTPVTITSSVAGVDVQVPMTFPTAAIVAAGKMRTDCGDLRVATQDGTLLPYWLESGCNGSTRLWVKIPTLSAGTTKIHLYYGNPAATSTSQINTTFVGNSTWVEQAGCPYVGEFPSCDITSHSSADAKRAVAPTCTAARSGVNYGSPCHATAVGTDFVDTFTAEYRFLFVPDVTGTWQFEWAADTWGELVINPTDNEIFHSMSPLAPDYTANTMADLFSHNRTLNAGTGAFYSFVVSDYSGTEGSRIKMKRPGGTLQTLTASNFPGMMFRRNYVDPLPAAAMSVEEALPGAPADLVPTAGPGVGEISLTWSAPASTGGHPILGYHVYMSLLPASLWAAPHANVSTLATTIAGIPDGELRYFRVAAYTTNGEGPLSATVSARAYDHPRVPRSLAAAPLPSAVALTWIAPSGDGGESIDGFNIYGKPASEPSPPPLLATTTSGANTSFTVNSLTNGVQYAFEVRAFNLVGEGPQAEVLATPGEPPGPPGDLAAVGGNRSITLTWTPAPANGRPLDDHRIWMGTSPGTQTLLATTGSGANTSFVVNGLTNGVTYWFNVTAHNELGWGVSSAEVSGLPAAKPNPPAGLAVVAGNRSLAASWSPPADDGGLGVSSYNLYHCILPCSSEDGQVVFGTSKTITGLANGTSYRVRVTAVNSLGESHIAYAVNATPVSRPDPPGNLAASHGDGSVQLSYDLPVDGGSALLGVNVYMGASEGAQTLHLANVAPVGNVLVTGLTNGVTYWFNLTAKNAAGESESSNHVSAIPLAPPGVPESFEATPGDHQVALAWTPGEDGGAPVLHWEVHMGVGTTETSLLETLPPGSTSHVATSLENGVVHYFRVRAANSQGPGAYSVLLGATPAGVPFPPMNLLAASGNGSASLSWMAADGNGAPVTAYLVYRSSGGPFVLLAETPATDFEDTGLVNGVTYHYYVTAVNAVGESAPSSFAFATPASIPDPPKLVAATRGDGTVDLSWSAGHDQGSALSGYKVWRSEGGAPRVLVASPGNVLSYLDAGLTNGLTYTYDVTALNALGESAPSNARSARPATVPCAPSISAGASGNGTASIEWIPGCTGGEPVTAFVVTAGAGATEHVQTLPPDVNAAIFGGLVNGQQYQLSVSAQNAVGLGTASDALPLTPSSIPDPPALLAASRADGEVLLTFLAGHDQGAALTEHRVFRASGGAAVLVATLPGGAEDHLDAGLTNGVVYTYHLTSVNARGESAPSNARSAKPASVPCTPTLAASPGNAEIHVSIGAACNGGEPLLRYLLMVVGDDETAFEHELPPTSTDFVATGLVNGVLYQLELRAENVVGASLPAGPVSVLPAGPPLAPTLVSATRGNGQVSLAWTFGSAEGSPIVSALVYRASGGGSPALVANLTDSGAGVPTSFVDTGLTNGVLYSYHVRALNAKGTSEPSNTLSARPARPPDPPQALSLVAGNATISASWGAPAANGGEPLLHYSVAYEATSPPGPIVESGTTIAQGHVVTGLENGVVYRIHVRAHNAAGASLAVTALARPARTPDAPVALVAHPGSQHVRLEWDAPAFDGGRPLQGYDIHAGTSPSSLAFVASIGLNESFTVNHLVDGTTYTFGVRARNLVGSGPFALASATPVSPPGPPTITDATALSPTEHIHLNWTAPTAGGGLQRTQYRLYASDAPSGPRSLVATLAPSVHTYVDSIPAGASRTYTVSAVNAAGEGALSNEATGSRVPDPLGPPPDTYRTCTRSTLSVTCTQGSQEDVVGLAAGARHTCALLADARVDCWGDNGAGQSGDHVSGRPVLAVAAGNLHTCALLDDGNVDCWGANAAGQATSRLDGNATNVSAGGSVTCFVRVDTSAVCQGANGYGQSAGRASGVMGVSVGGHHVCFLLTTRVVECQGRGLESQTVGDLTGDVVEVAAGGFHTCVRTLASGARCWGDIPTPPTALAGHVERIASGRAHACALLDDGNVACWGSNRDGQSASYAGGDAVAIAAGDAFTCALRAAGDVVCWGSNPATDFGQSQAYPGPGEASSADSSLPASFSQAAVAPAGDRLQLKRPETPFREA